MVAADTVARLSDSSWSRALFLAERGRGRTSPNPMVGAVSCPTGVVVGQGAHLRAGGLARRSHRTRCGRWKRPAPRSIARSSRVATSDEPDPARNASSGGHLASGGRAMTDPNPSRSGGGFAYLRVHGVGVDIGEGDSRARRLERAVRHW
jgi:diaminohydroxyphosphoribosylaminopyrimidine deaminase/5-amino-6-(5-phosphoribosylamino)uracil reductase